jgi:membrane associated rhomboid family serine protease
MFLPLHDTVPLRRMKAPYVTRLIVALNVAVYLLLQSGLVLDLGQGFVMGFGLIPRVLVGDGYLDGIPHVATALTPFTSLFLHGGWMHLGANMLFMWIFGDNVEDAMGHARFLVFYLLCGALSGYAYALSTPLSESPLIGASGAVSAVIGAYLVLHPRVHIFGLIFNIIPLTLRAQWALGAWILYQFGHAVLDADRSTAWVAHLGGVLAGALLVMVFKAREVPLFGRQDEN